MKAMKDRLSVDGLRGIAKALLGTPLPLARWEIAGYACLIAAGAAMRLWDLASRAMHHDESLHALYSYNLASGDGYTHNPMMHGPFQFESNAAIFFAFGDSDYTARLGVAVMGVLLIALPMLFRARLGRPGALIVAAGIAVSPAMLYFSRFARNDIYMAVWSLGLVIAMWRYLEEGRSRYLYAGAALLALAFATKETAFILVSILGSYLVLQILVHRSPSMRPAADLEGLSPPEAARTLFRGIRSGLARPLFEGAERHGAFLTMLATLSLVQWSALVSYLQDTPLLRWSNLVLAQPVGSANIGAPAGSGLVIAFLVVAGLLALSIYWGYRWNWSVWWKCALIFWAIWILTYSTFFTNPAGIASGIWQSLGYWVIQQDVARGNQPWYYYFMITSVYEFLPLIFGMLAAVYYVRRRDPFGAFLAYWALMTLAMYTAASEKMPWLLVNLTLPLIVLTGKLLGEAVERVAWKRVVSRGGWLALPGVPLLAVLLWTIAYYDPGPWMALAALAAAGIAALGVYLARVVGPRSFAAAAALSLALMLAVFSLRAGVTVAYHNADTPVELLVYTQTTPDVVELMNRIEKTGSSGGQGDVLPVKIDQTSGFSWPWAWYLRDRPEVHYLTDYGGSIIKQSEDPSVVLVHLNNKAATDDEAPDSYAEGRRFRHRWWFPEDAYRNLTIRKFLSGLLDGDSRRAVMSYLLDREGIRERIGSEDAVAYFPSNSQPSERDTSP